MKIKHTIKIIWLTFLAKHFSLDKKFRKLKATACTYRIKGDDSVGNIVVNVDGIDYYFEGKPIIKKYKNGINETVVFKEWKYGGWGVSLKDKRNKLI